MYRRDLGAANDEPGCVATYPVGDDTCEDTPREYALATCKSAGEDDVGEPDILVDKRTSEPGCAQSDIEEVEVNCDEWCLETSLPGYPRNGICRVVTADNCGSEEAAHCYCGLPKWASTKGPNLSGCKEKFEDPDACPDEGSPLREVATCDGDDIVEFPQMGCAPGILTHVRDCDAWCKDEGHSGGTCQDASVDVTCPSGAVVQSAQCECD